MKFEYPSGTDAQDNQTMNINIYIIIMHIWYFTRL